MVNQALVQAKVNAGFAKVAAALGVSCQWYRPSGPSNPLNSGNLLGTLQVLFDTNANLGQIAPRQRQKPEEWYGAFDKTGVAVGDYLITPTPETFFITTMDPFRTSRLVLCNKVVTIANPPMLASVGLNLGYSGDIRAIETPVIVGWPGFLTKGPRGDTGDARLPGDAKQPWEELLLPVLPGATLRNDQILTYSDGTDTFRLILSMVELTSLGYRCTAILETA